MKKIFYLFLLQPIFVLAQTSSNNKPAESTSPKEIHFEHTTFAEIQAKAKAENKMIMMDAVTSWCGPCKWMAKNIFTTDTAAEFYNKNFICAKIDMEKGEGIDLAKKYNVGCYPTYLFIDHNGKLIHRMSGSMYAKQFVELGTDAMNPGKQFASMQKQYESGQAAPDKMAEYILARTNSCMPVKEELANYFSTQKESDLLLERNWSLMNQCAMYIGSESREWKYLIDQYDVFAKQYGSKNVDKFIQNGYSSNLQSRIKEKNIPEYNKTKEEILKKNFPFTEQLLLKTDMSLYTSTGDWKNYAQTAVNYIEKYAKDDYNTLNNISWTFYEKISDKELLLKAEEWVKHSTELQPGYFNYDTYAAVLYKLGKKSEAEATAKKAIELAKQEGQDYKGTAELLDKIKELK